MRGARRGEDASKHPLHAGEDGGARRRQAGKCRRDETGPKEPVRRKLAPTPLIIFKDPIESMEPLPSSRAYLRASRKLEHAPL